MEQSFSHYGLLDSNHRSLASDITIAIPIPHADLSQEKLAETSEDFRNMQLRVSVRGEGNYPCSHTWIEIAILSLTAKKLVDVALDHYAGKIFDALDRLVIASIKTLTVTFLNREHSRKIDLERENREDAIARVAKALREIEVNNNPD